MSFQMTRNELRRHSSATQADFISENFQDDDSVWRGDSGDIVIGDQSDFDEDDATQYVYVGTVAEYVQQLRNLIEAR